MTDVQILRAQTIVPEVPETMTFRDAQKVVGGYVEVVRVPAGGCLLVNEDGQLRRLPVNEAATALAGRPIVGDAVFLLNTAAVNRVLGGA